MWQRYLSAYVYMLDSFFEKIDISTFTPILKLCIRPADDFFLILYLDEIRIDLYDVGPRRYHSPVFP